MKFSKRTTYMLFGSIIFIAISLRYPFTPHEVGWDSFDIHGLINDLNFQGSFRSWWVHPLSPFGLTPFSYASAVPVILSAFSQCSGLSIESSIWLFGVFCGIFGIFVSYLLAKEVFNNDVYIFLVVFGFTTGEVFLDLTTWTLSTRGFFMTFLPIFLFLIIKNSKSKKFNIYSVLTILVFICLVAIHHLYTFLILPIISFIILKRIYPFKKIKKRRNLRRITNIFTGLFLLIMIILILNNILSSISVTNLGKMSGESNIEWFNVITRQYARQLGILGLFGIFGFLCLLYKPGKSLNEIMLLFFLLVLIPFILISGYMISFIAIFIYLSAGFGLYYIYELIYRKKNMKIAAMIIVLILSISLAFSAFYQINHPSVDTTYNKIYNEEDTYDTGLWLKYTINNSSFFSNDHTSSVRIAGVMNIKQFPGTQLEQLNNGFISMDDYETDLGSPFDSYFWSESYYIETTDSPDIHWYANVLPEEDYHGDFSKELLFKYDIKYVIENEVILSHYEIKDKIFFITLNENCYKVYANPKISVWYSI